MMLFLLTCRHISIFISRQFLVYTTWMAKIEYWKPGWLSQVVFFLYFLSRKHLSLLLQIQDKKKKLAIERLLHMVPAFLEANTLTQTLFERFSDIFPEK